MGQTWLLQRGAGPQALTMAETAATVHTAEGFFLSLQFSPPTLPSCPRAWSPEDSTVAVGHRSQHRGSQEHTTSPLPNDFPAVRRDQNPKVTGDCCPHLHSDLILPAPTPFFLATSTWHAPDLLPKHTVSNADCCGAPGDEKAHSALCQASPVVLSCRNLNPFLLNCTISIRKIMLLLADLSGSNP